uniref:GCM domain-containing protein n=1 Tax=Steinernema glaseri TaxID=37863 RepID=A0A1I7Z8E5_9BILA
MPHDAKEDRILSCSKEHKSAPCSATEEKAKKLIRVRNKGKEHLQKNSDIIRLLQRPAPSALISSNPRFHNKESGSYALPHATQREKQALCGSRR